MAHEITRSDGLVLTGAPAWHGIGTVVEKAPSPAEALRIARLDWTVETVPLTAEREIVGIDAGGVPFSEKKPLPVRTHVANVRSDNADILGVVGAGYAVVQNRDIVPLIYDAANAERVTIETAGSLRGGRDIFFLAHLDTFDLGARDISHTYALFLNSHDGSGALRVLPTSVRVVCANTRRAALNAKDARRLTVSMRHTSGLPARIEDIRASLRGAAALAASEVEKARALAARTLSAEETSAFFRGAYAALYGDLPRGRYADLSQGDKAKVSRARDMAEAWNRTLAAERETFGSAPTAWLAANAITRWIDHDRPTRGGDRMASNLIGSAADAKDIVFGQALALAGVA